MTWHYINYLWSEYIKQNDIAVETNYEIRIQSNTNNEDFIHADWLVNNENWKKKIIIE